MSPQPPAPPVPSPPPSPDAALHAHERAVLEAIRAVGFGTVEVTVHQSRIVQITRSEKVRL